MILALALAALPIGHSHNDYLQPRPLLDALEAGLTSIEADVFLVEGELRVAHELVNTKPGRTLESLYLDPLLARKGVRDLILLVDIKADGLQVYRELAKKLPKYRSILTRWQDGKRQKGSVTILLSGDRPIEAVRQDKTRWVAIDGRLPDLKPGLDPELFPMISAPWASTFGASNNSPLAGESLAKLTAYAKQAKEAGVILRFWGAPDREPIWSQLKEVGVGAVGTDRPAALGRFLHSGSSSTLP